MAAEIAEITESLGARRRFIATTVHDLDSGEVYAAAEVGRIPKGVDPLVLSRNKKRFDIGDAICRPMLNFIPANCTPNLITFINHIMNWLLLWLVVQGMHYESGWQQATCLVGAAALNFFCMMLDCLDGMHARNTNQCSKLGEVLDHWLDSLHVPLVCGGICIAIRSPMFPTCVMMSMNAAVYASEMIIYHYQGVFLQTSGVEAQIATSGLYLIAASLAAMKVTGIVVDYYQHMVIFGASVIVMILLLKDFWLRFGAKEWRAFALFSLQLAIFLPFALQGYLSRLDLILVLSFISFRLTGSYVMQTILKNHFNGYDIAIFHWAIGFAGGHLCMDAIPLSRLLNRVLPYVNALVGDGVDVTYGLTAQQLLPIFFCLHIGYRNVKELNFHYYTIKNLR